MPGELLKKCVAARKDGRNFPSIFETIIRPDPLCGGGLKNTTDGKRIWLSVPLTTGQSLVYESKIDQFRLE